MSAGDGAHGHRWYDWALIDLAAADRDHDQRRGHHALLIRRSRVDGELAFYRTWTPVPVSLQTLVTVAGRRWTIEEAFQSAKGLTGLDAHQVRRWTSRQRWTVLTMLAHAILTVLAATTAPTPSTPRAQAAKDDNDHDRAPVLAPLTRNEIQRLIPALANPIPVCRDNPLKWSHRRRQAQARARDSHHRQQAAIIG